MFIYEYIKQVIYKIAYLDSLIDGVILDRFNEYSKKYSEICDSLFLENEKPETSSDGYDWGGWSGKIRGSFNPGVPLGFLGHPTIAYTMVFARRFGVEATRQRVNYILNILSEDIAANLLLEDYIGLPAITDSRFRTSANRSHHASHLTKYYETTGRYFWDTGSIVEWGGGYGNMARIIRKMKPDITYVILDLPELLALQYIYLSSLEREENVNLINHIGQLDIHKGKINLIPAHLILSSETNFTFDSFLSTWAITESPKQAQQYVNANNFFGANNILLASKIDQNNYLTGAKSADKCKKIGVPTFKGIKEGHEYWFS